MGSSASAPVVEEETFIAEGSLGKVYLQGDGNVLKRGKQKTPQDGPSTEIGRELRAYAWIDTIPAESEMHAHFAHALQYRVFRDKSFTHVQAQHASDMEKIDTFPKEVADKFRQYQATLDERNSWPYTYELVIENKGRRIDHSQVTPANMRRGLIQILKIIEFFKKNEIEYVDFHLGNILVREGPEGQSEVALVDYGEFYMKGDEEYEPSKREHTMMIQLVGMKTDINNTFAMEATSDPSQQTTVDKRIKYALAVDDVRKKILQVTSKVSYRDPVSRVLLEGADANLVYSMLLDIMKVKYPARFIEMMGFSSSTTPLHTWFEWDQVEVIYDNLNNVPAAIRHFENEYKTVGGV
jgi:hypothetical protein